MSKKFEELDSALELLDQYNKMSFEDFIVFMEKESGGKLNKSVVDQWRFTGLNNLNFYMGYRVRLFK